MKKHTHFLETEIQPSIPEKALFHFISAPYEKTVSYGKGTAKGPAAILKASLRLETFDGISIPGNSGIHTCKPLDCRGPHTKALGRITRNVEQVISMGAVPVVLGGEHTVTLGSAEAFFRNYGKNFAIVHFDAHTDLRDSYQGSKYSHGCVMRRIFSDLGIGIFQIGIRSLSYEEHVFRLENKIGHLDACEFAFGKTPELCLPAGFPDNIFVSIDIDALDPALIPATGTPEPGGLSWYQMMYCLDALSRKKRVIGFDLVELAPIPKVHSADFAAARLIYNFMGFIARNNYKK